MARHTHEFVETCTDLIAFGLNRETDEDTVVYYLQKFSDDQLMRTLIKRLSDAELADLFDRVNDLMRKHLNDSEYHRLFLKEE